MTYIVLRDWSNDQFVDSYVIPSPCWEIVAQGEYEECRKVYDELVEKAATVKLLAQVLSSNDRGRP